ncbi:protein-disulfide reductase DsbD N-terminal domain-containing protein [Acidiphilium sp. PA]|nr:protein-disulfide reductase DsbD domain-containing protein [Acidiphilium sp. PA]MCW8309134.1 protein-disulfide reductase DsbD N-terminal domain-containing protein [Acidiphilium sp. PA]
MVRLNIKKGWHVNANPASLRFLIPTTVKSEINHKAVRLDISYPPGRDSHVKLDGKSILVYDDNTILRADMPASTLAQLRSAGSLSLVVTVQSCSNKGICLPPAQLRSTIAAHF